MGVEQFEERVEHVRLPDGLVHGFLQLAYSRPGWFIIICRPTEWYSNSFRRADVGWTKTHEAITCISCLAGEGAVRLLASNQPT